MDAAARRVFRMKWINTFGKLSRKTDGLSDVEMPSWFHGNKFHVFLILKNMFLQTSSCQHFALKDHEVSGSCKKPNHDAP